MKTQIIINIEDGKCTLGGEEAEVRKAESNPELLPPSKIIVESNLAKSLWETIKHWKINTGQGFVSATPHHVGLIIDAVIRAKEWDAKERQDILDKVNKQNL